MTPRESYWLDALTAALFHINTDLPATFTEDQLYIAAQALAISAENESLGMGYDAIPNPLTAEVEQERRKREGDALDYARQLRDKDDTISELHQKVRRLKGEIDELKNPFPPRWR